MYVCIYKYDKKLYVVHFLLHVVGLVRCSKYQTPEVVEARETWWSWF